MLQRLTMNGRVETGWVGNFISSRSPPNAQALSFALYCREENYKNDRKLDARKLNAKLIPQLLQRASKKSGERVVKQRV